MSMSATAARASALLVPAGNSNTSVLSNELTMRTGGSTTLTGAGCASSTGSSACAKVDALIDAYADEADDSLDPEYENHATAAATTQARLANATTLAFDLCASCAGACACGGCTTICVEATMGAATVTARLVGCDSETAANESKSSALNSISVTVAVVAAVVFGVLTIRLGCWL